MRIIALNSIYEPFAIGKSLYNSLTRTWIFSLKQKMELSVLAMNYACLPWAPAHICGIIFWGYHGLMLKVKWEKH